MLTEQEIRQFRDLWQSRFGEEISDEKAKEEGLKLVRLVEAVYKPVNKQNLTDINKK
ncbi:MAG: hypothetical protein GF335_04855 [Candidatus Moranbacteria bacterium]|nr:hypothetical protein [Candidatus Moranbacteria bacterium]